jgi:hypothetical protein
VVLEKGALSEWWYSKDFFFGVVSGIAKLSVGSMWMDLVRVNLKSERRSAYVDSAAKIRGGKVYGRAQSIEVL